MNKDSAPLLKEMEGLRVTVDRITYEPDADTPEDRPHAYRYDVTIHNEGFEIVRILARKWIVTDSTGDKLVVEGDGVVGQTPLLRPGESFSYHSYHVLARDSVAEGFYYGRTSDGVGVYCRIPAFKMCVPGVGEE